jgi:hypothetical protein
MLENPFQVKGKGGFSVIYQRKRRHNGRRFHRSFTVLTDRECGDQAHREYRHQYS